MRHRMAAAVTLVAALGSRTPAHAEFPFEDPAPSIGPSLAFEPCDAIGIGPTTDGGAAQRLDHAAAERGDFEIAIDFGISRSVRIQTACLLEAHHWFQRAIENYPADDRMFAKSERFSLGSLQYLYVRNHGSIVRSYLERSESDTPSSDDMQQALEWARRGAAVGDRMSQLKLGEMYIEGRGVSVSYMRGYMWSSLSALPREGEPARLSLIDRVDVNLAGTQLRRVELRMTPAEIAEARRLVQACLKVNYLDCGEPGERPGLPQPRTRPPVPPG